MKCPYCNYEHGWNNSELKDVEGEKGSFYSLSNNIDMRRTIDYDDDKEYLYACPKCGKVFIKVSEL